MTFAVIHEKKRHFVAKIKTYRPYFYSTEEDIVGVARSRRFWPESESEFKTAWELPIVERNWENMLRVADQVCRARLLATAQRESGAWLNALPVSSLGTLLDSESFKVAIALRMGADVCIPHSCRCGGRMDSRGLHGLSCRYSAGRFPRHSAINDVVKRALQKAGLPSVLEPPGLD